MMSSNYQMDRIQCRIVKLYRVHHKKRETLPTNPSIQIYINKINNR